MFPSSSLHSLPHEAAAVGLLLQPLPQGVGVGPVHVDLAEHVEAGVVRRRKRFDLRLRARFLHAHGESALMRYVWSLMFVLALNHGQTQRASQTTPNPDT